MYLYLLIKLNYKIALFVCNYLKINNIPLSLLIKVHLLEIFNIRFIEHQNTHIGVDFFRTIANISRIIIYCVEKPH